MYAADGWINTQAMIISQATVTAAHHVIRNLAIVNRSRVSSSSAQKVTTVRFKRGVVDGGRSIMGGGRCRKHKFHGRIVFFKGRKKCVTLGSAATRPI